MDCLTLFASSGCAVNPFLFDLKAPQSFLAMANPSDDAGKTSGGDLPSVGDVGRMSMSDYHTLTHLLEKAKREDRLGEVLHTALVLTKMSKVTLRSTRTSCLDVELFWILPRMNQLPSIPFRFQRPKQRALLRRVRICCQRWLWDQEVLLWLWDQEVLQWLWVKQVRTSRRSQFEVPVPASLTTPSNYGPKARDGTKRERIHGRDVT